MFDSAFYERVIRFFFSESSELQISILVLPMKENEDSKVFWLLLFEKYIAQ